MCTVEPLTLYTQWAQNTHTNIVQLLGVILDMYTTCNKDFTVEPLWTLLDMLTNLKVVRYTNMAFGTDESALFIEVNLGYPHKEVPVHGCTYKSRNV